MPSVSELNGSNGFVISGDGEGDQMGLSVDAAGDINNDGIDDFLVSSRGLWEEGQTFDGEVHVVFGTSSGFPADVDVTLLDGTNGFTIKGTGSFENFGLSVSSAGDVNGDGIDDILIGAPSAGGTPGNNGAGEAYVVFGSDAPFDATVSVNDLDGTNGFAIGGGLVNSQVGVAVDAVGDLNGDGIDDIIVGASQANGGGITYSGQVSIIYGSTTGFDSVVSLPTLGIDGVTGSGSAAFGAAGSSVAGIGDVNGDGYDDFAVGAPDAPADGAITAGQAFIVFGDEDGLPATFNLSDVGSSVPGLRIDGDLSGNRTGSSLAAAGDINGDGIDDVVIGASTADSPGYDSGAAYVVFGSSALGGDLDVDDLDGTKGITLVASEGASLVGSSVAGIGDFNGDGIDDIAIGGTNANGGAGSVWVVYGSDSGFDAVIDLSTLDPADGMRIDGIDAGDAFGFSVAGAGDINGDGYDDLIVGAIGVGSVPAVGRPGDPDYVPGVGPSGEAYVIYGGLYGSPSDVTLTGDSLSETTAAGDVVGTVEVTRSDFAETWTYALVDDADGRFTLVGNSVVVADGATFDFETEDNVTIAVEVTDSEGNSLVQSFTIAITDVNEAPIGIDAATQDLEETAEAGTTVAMLSVIDPDVSDSFTYSLSDDADGRFEIVGDEIRVAAGAVFDFESATSVALGVIVTDAGGLTYETTILVNVVDVNEVPTDIIVGGASVAENATEGTVVAEVSGLDPDAGDVLSFYMDDPSGLFELVETIDGAEIRVAAGAAIDFETQETHVVTLYVTDAAGNERSEELIISVLDVSPSITGTAGNDVITGTDEEDTIDALGGNDTVFGGLGDDTIYGGIGNDRLTGDDGNDTLVGGAGNDVLTGGIGNDVLVIDDAGDRVTELAGGGVDEVRTGLTTLSLATNGMGYVEILTYTGSGQFFGTGNALANQITGGSGADSLNGAGGADTMIGLGGMDTYVVNVAGDIVVEGVDGGLDVVRSTVTYVLPENVEAIYLDGTGSISATGNDGDNLLEGNSGNNTLDGGAGRDEMRGGFGNDTYIIDDYGDSARETPGASGGNDTIQTSLSVYSIDTSPLIPTTLIENLRYIGTDDFTGSGSDIANSIYGASGNDFLFGGGGNDQLFGDAGVDTIYGGSGVDTMRGGDGDDTYYVDVSQDRIIETVDGGIDQVFTYTDYVLSGSVENISYLGSTPGSITGNGLANTLTAYFDTAVSMSGLGGNDTLIGGGGDDTMNGGSGADVFVFLTNFGDDQIIGFDANPTGGQDLLDVSSLGITSGNFSSRVVIVDVGADVQILIDGGVSGSITLTGISSVTSVTQDDFIL